LFLKKAWS